MLARWTKVETGAAKMLFLDLQLKPGSLDTGELLPKMNEKPAVALPRPSLAPSLVEHLHDR